MNTYLSPSATVRANVQHLSADLEGETIILSLIDGVYHVLNPVGAGIWQLLQEPQTVAEIEASLLATYDVESEQCRGDLLKLLAQLVDKHLVEVSDERVGTPGPSPID